MEFPFRPGAVVIAYLQDPREKIWGLLLGLDVSGVSLRGIDLRSFDDWLRDAAGGEGDGIRPSVAFYPMARIEKILLDEAADGAPSLDARCVARTGLTLREQIDRLDRREDAADPDQR